MLGVLLVVPVLASARASDALGAGREFKNPIAFVGVDGIYMTDPQGANPTPLITGNTAGFLIYSRARWAPDGEQVLASEFTAEKNGNSPLTRVLLVTSGSKPEALKWSLDTGWPEILPTAWLPASKQVVYTDGQAVYLVPFEGTQAKLLFKQVLGGSLGEPGNGLDPSALLLAREQEREIYRTAYHVIATGEGLLLGGEWLEGETWGLVSLEGKALWKAALSTEPVASPDGKRAVAGYFGYLKDQTAPPEPGAEPVVLIDLKTGKVSELPVQGGAAPLGWSADGKSIYLALREKVASVQGKSDSEVGQAMFEVEWPITATEYNLTLWRLPLEGSLRSKGVKLFEVRGYDFGVMTVSSAAGGEKLPLVVSVVSSSVPLIQAINSGAKREDAATLMPTVRLYAIDPESGRMLWAQQGGRPAYGKDRFMVVVSP